MEITQELLKEYVTYEPITGVFTKRKKKHPRDNTVKVGEQLGHLSGDGYIHFSFFGKKGKAHRLAWLYVYGELPNSLIDHIDGDKTNNKINNLRLASFEQNAANRHVVKSKTENNNAVYGRRSDWQSLYTIAKDYFKKVLDNSGSARLVLTDPRSTENGRVYNNPYQYFFQQMMMDDAVLS